jgi:hypothetical protein
MEIANTFIAILALVLSAVALYYSRIQHLQAEEILVKEEILRVIKEFRRYQLIVSEMKREREKTGSELDQGEIKLFQQFDSMHSQQDQLEDLLEIMLMRKKFKANNELLSQALITKTKTEAMTQHIELLHQRFLRFNQNKLPELKERLDKISTELDKYKPAFEAFSDSINAKRT